MGLDCFWLVKDVSWLGGHWQLIFLVEDQTMLLGEERSTNVIMMDKAREVWSKENAIIFPCINAIPMEED